MYKSLVIVGCALMMSLYGCTPEDRLRGDAEQDTPAEDVEPITPPESSPNPVPPVDDETEPTQPPPDDIEPPAEGEDDPPGDDTAFILAPTSPVEYNHFHADNQNPERGFYHYVNLLEQRDFAYVRANNGSLVYSYIRLDDYRDRDIAAAVLNQLQDGFDAARQSGVKVIPRFAYNFGPYPDSEPDAAYPWVMRHIEQVTPILEANADVIAVVQAGFIGAWGEWHTSTNGLLDDPDTWQSLLNALLTATPANRSVQLRYPAHKGQMYPSPLHANGAFSTAPQARLGHHNDCFLASDTDQGTYPSQQVEQWKDYLQQDTGFVPMGGETCKVSHRSHCAMALSELERFHFSYLNRHYHPDVLAQWQAEGCYTEIEQRLGYRLELATSQLPQAVVPGGRFRVEINLRNTGFAAPVNQRPLYLVLHNSDVEYSAHWPNVDMRYWLPEQHPSLIADIQLPHSIAEGDYELSLWLPDSAASLRDRSEYAIRISNALGWHAEKGLNRLTELRVTHNATGSSNAQATQFQLVDPE